MSWLRYFRRSRWDDERRQEMESYVELETDDNIARGMSRRDAHAKALRTLGNPTLIREEVYRMNTLAWLDSAVRDLRYGARVLLRQPMFALVAILSLTLGIGANTAIFQLIDTVRMRVLPVASPDTLARVAVDSGDRGRTGRSTGRYAHMTYPIYEQVRDRQQSFSELAAWGPALFDLSAAGESRPAQGIWVSGNFFSALGVAPRLGRLIGSEEDQPGCASPSVVLSHAFWQREYAGRADVVGETILIDGHRFPIAGVTNETFFGVEVGRQFDVALPLCAEGVLQGSSVSALRSRDWWWLAGIGRLKPGVTMERANAELATISATVFKETVPPNYSPADAESFLTFTVRAESVTTGFSRLRTTYGTPLSLLLGLAGLVLLIACGNLANLLLARASAREREMAVRLAIGASRVALIRQLMAESLLVAAAGAVLGAWLAHGLSGLVVALVSTSRSPLMLDLSFNWRVLAFTAAVAAMTSVLFGLVPAVRATQTAPVTAMRASGHGLTQGRGRFTLRRGLVVAQLAVSLVLLVGALLFVRTFQNLGSVDVGFATAGVQSINIDYRRAEVPADSRPTINTQVVERISAIPGVAGATPVAVVPMSGSGWNQSLVVDGTEQEGYPNVNAVDGNFFALLDIPLVSGRTFDDRDRLGTPRVSIVNESFAKKYLSQGDPIGRSFTFEVRPGVPTVFFEVIGVVGDTTYRDVHEPNGPIAYLPFAQEEHLEAGLSVLVRLSHPDTPITRAAVDAVTSLQAAALVTVSAVESDIANSLVAERLMATLSGFFGALALMLAAIGLYGVMSYMVAQRRQEIGIRMALGAGRGRVLGMVLREAGVMLTIGVTLGAGLAYVAGKTASTLLFGLEAHDPITLALAVSGLVVIGAGASVLPAWRAARVNPTTALRQS